MPLFKSNSKWKIILMKMTLICMKMKLHAELIFIWKVLHLDSFWNRGTRELGNGLFKHNCCGASVASEQQHKQDLRRVYKGEDEFSKSSLFTRMLCGFLPECIAPSWVHCATNNTRLWHCSNGVFSLRGLQLRQVSGYGLLWFTSKTMWARSCLAFTTLAVVVNAEFASLEIWTINCDVLI